MTGNVLNEMIDDDTLSAAVWGVWFTGWRASIGAYLGYARLNASDSVKAVLG
jgi:hypothetical protein